MLIFNNYSNSPFLYKLFLGQAGLHRKLGLHPKFFSSESPFLFNSPFDYGPVVYRDHNYRKEPKFLDR